MKLLLVHQYLGEFGGAETNIQMTANELRRRGHTVGLLYRQTTSRNEDLWRQTFSEIFCMPTDGNVEAVEAVLEGFSPDLIYLHNLQDLKVVAALLDSSVPMVRMVHDHSMYCMRSYKYSPLTRTICTRAASPYCVFPCMGMVSRQRGSGFPFKFVSYAEKRREILLNQRCNAFVVYSDYLRQELVRNGYEERKIEVCVPLQTQSSSADEISAFGPENLVLFVGQLIRGKGVDSLLRALAQVKSAFQCIIIGDGNHRRYCERLSARLGLQARVRFQGYVLRSELREYYLRASLFVMSSLWPEPFGMAGPEAMRFGLPVVAYDAGGIREWLQHGENGYLVPWNRTELFAARVDELLADKEFARRMGRRGLGSIEQFEASRQMNGLEQLFQRVLTEGRLRATAPAATALVSTL